MAEWSGWTIERLTVAFLGVAYLAVWAQLTLYHYKGAFHKWEMWAPVLYTPLAVIAAFVYAGARTPLTANLFLLAFAVGALEGLVGTYFHLRGIAKRVGGFTLSNVLAGPPPILPVIYAAIGGFGALVGWLGMRW